MPDHLKEFYTLEKVKNELAKSADPKLSSNLAIKRFIDTHQLTPYVHYKGFINSVKSVYSKSREDIIKELSAIINEDITSLQLKELVDPQRYDASLDVDAIIYQTKKLLTTFSDKYDRSYDNIAYYSEGIFSISPNNVILDNLGLKVIIRDNNPISHHVKFILNNPFDHKAEDNYSTILLDFHNKVKLQNNSNHPPFVTEDEVVGWILHMPDSDYQKMLKLRKKCELIFSSKDLNFILRRIENINLAPKLDKDLKEANRLISQQNKEIEKLKKELKKSQDQQPGNDVKDSVYSLILVLKDLLLNPDINAYHFKSDRLKSTGEPTQSGLIQHIINEKIPKLGQRNVEDIFADANKNDKQ